MAFRGGHLAPPVRTRVPRSVESPARGGSESAPAGALAFMREPRNADFVTRCLLRCVTPSAVGVDHG